MRWWGRKWWINDQCRDSRGMRVIMQALSSMNTLAPQRTHVSWLLPKQFLWVSVNTGVWKCSLSLASDKPLQPPELKAPALSLGDKSGRCSLPGHCSCCEMLIGDAQPPVMKGRGLSSASWLPSGWWGWLRRVIQAGVLEWKRGIRNRRWPETDTEVKGARVGLLEGTRQMPGGLHGGLAVRGNSSDDSHEHSRYEGGPGTGKPVMCVCHLLKDPQGEDSGTTVGTSPAYTLLFSGGENHNLDRVVVFPF